MQKTRENERENIYNDYINRIGEMVYASIKRYEFGRMIIELRDNVEAVVPLDQQARHERWSTGERIRAVIIKVHNRPNLQVELSRTAPELLSALFVREVPETFGTVVIKSAVRDPGKHAKIAVVPTKAKAGDLDVVRWFQKRSNVEPIIKELRGEKVEVIGWSDDLSVFAANALTPAKVNQVRIIDSEDRFLEAIVDENQLHLALGRDDENVRLASRLLGWHINVRSEEEIQA